ncbi:hypothetical protein E5676_scaffold1251G00540 [Cucumis melo var. makuwa]|uniref:Ty3-gypsy retrotransposon protein n=1 Tax=Cucumis melo var. makuwa TaxID=1194695 RepID=A0A5A7TSS0_CUCMM|nr:hypothetical protein E6C27_scaffold543G00390 [Cucumis melo var. makuwa]TYJ97750.1 hypothetical protein E5676_scaffold1251G00540 [Cucumis melo var. makuwa]
MWIPSRAPSSTTRAISARSPPSGSRYRSAAFRHSPSLTATRQVVDRVGRRQAPVASTVAHTRTRKPESRPPPATRTYGLKRCNLDLGTSLVGKRDFTARIRVSKSPVRRNRQFGIDINMIRVVRRNRSQPDCLSVSSGYTTEQIVLGVLLRSPKTSYVPSRSHIARVRERASSWAKAEVRAKASWRATGSDRGGP